MFQALKFDEAPVTFYPSRDVLRKIGDCDPTWEQMVPKSVANVIKDRKFFDYQCDTAPCAVPA